MSRDTYFILALILGGLFILFLWLKRSLVELTQKGKDEDPLKDLRDWLKSMQQSVENTNQSLNNALRSTNQNITKTLQTDTKNVSERLDKAAEVISNLQKHVGELSEIGRGMKDLQDFLRSPKLRGNIGEQVLRELLGQTLPKQAFHLQYTFKSGERVDAAIRTDAGIIPIDSKFPMENIKGMAGAKTETDKKTYQRNFVNDVRKHIRDISSKYILPEEGTLDYALMYIPSEAVYYEIMANIPELADYAHEMRVLPVSPSTFYAYLRAILMSFEGKKIEERAKQILQNIKAIQKDYLKVEGTLAVLGKHVQNAYNQMNNVTAGFTSLGQKISSTQALGEGAKEARQIKAEI